MKNADATLRLASSVVRDSIRPIKHKSYAVMVWEEFLGISGNITAIGVGIYGLMKIANSIFKK